MKDMLDLAKHIVDQRSGDFEPGKFEDRYEAALVDLLNKKRNGERISAIAQPRDNNNAPAPRTRKPYAYSKRRAG